MPNRKGWSEAGEFGIVTGSCAARPMCRERKGAPVLTLTDTASTVVKEIVSRAEDAASGGLRIDAATPQATEFAVAIADRPEADDAVVEQGGARVFLGADATDALADKTLDARVDHEGRVTFDVLQQPLA
jgi:Fe-S cluster assembly iron-binding protein IscA